jgi:FKBP-type peptidyl-prolyl cis-trans isomerase
MVKGSPTKSTKSMADLIAEERKRRGMAEAPTGSMPSAAQRHERETIKKKKKKQKQPLVMPSEEELARLRRRDEDDAVDSESELAVAAVITPGKLHITPQLVEYTDMRLGQGDGCVMLRSSVLVEYTGRLASTGAVFDQSKAKTPLAFTIGKNSVVEGFEDGMLGMKLGGERTIHVPAELGYGREGFAACRIPPNTRLRFDVRLVGLS